MHSTRKRKEDWAKEVYNPIQIRIVMPQRGRGREIRRNPVAVMTVDSLDLEKNKRKRRGKES
jgi:hypothetical protein